MRLEEEISRNEPERMDAAVARMLEKGVRRGEEEEKKSGEETRKEEEGGAEGVAGGATIGPEPGGQVEDEEERVPKEVLEIGDKVSSKVRREVGETRGGVELFVDVAKANAEEMRAIEWIPREERRPFVVIKDGIQRKRFNCAKSKM